MSGYSPSYGELIITTTDKEYTNEIMQRTDKYVAKRFPQAIGRSRGYIAVGGDYKVEAMKNISVPGFFLPTANSATEAANHQYSGESNVYFPGIDLETKNLTIYQTQIAAKQALFAGGQVRNANKMANEAVAIADQATALTTSEVVLNTDQAFWQLVSIQEQVKVAEHYVTMLFTFSAVWFVLWFLVALWFKPLFNEGLAMKPNQFYLSVAMAASW